MMRGRKGFTLIELLIVVAIIAILAAIAIPNFLEAQIRSKVSRTKTDMRSVATALEAYMVDTNMYPQSAKHDPPDEAFSVNSGLPDDKAAKFRLTFGVHTAGDPAKLQRSITTPISYMSSLPGDVFADTRGCTFGYWNASEAGWIMWSYGPDADEFALWASYKDSDPSSGSQLDAWFADVKDEDLAPYDYSKQSLYNPYRSNPSRYLSTGWFVVNVVQCSFTYDTSNGAVSKGDIWRHRQ